MAATNFVIAKRWHLVLGDKSPIRPSRLLPILFVGCFFNQVLPTGIGGDAMRAWRCKLSGMSLTTAIGSVLIDRVSGYIVLVVIYAAGMPALLAVVRNPLLQRLLLLVLGGAVCGMAAFFLMDRLPRALLRLSPVGSPANLSIEARKVLLKPPRALSIFALAAIATALTALSADFAGRSVGIDLSFSRWLIILPPVSLFQLLPVSLAGWGVREAALVVILGDYGIPAEAALAASLCIGLSQILVGSPSGLI